MPLISSCRRRAVALLVVLTLLFPPGLVQESEPLPPWARSLWRPFSAARARAEQPEPPRLFEGGMQLLPERLRPRASAMRDLPAKPDPVPFWDSATSNTKPKSAPREGQFNYDKPNITQLDASLEEYARKSADRLEAHKENILEFVRHHATQSDNLGGGGLRDRLGILEQKLKDLRSNEREEVSFVDTDEYIALFEELASIAQDFEVVREQLGSEMAAALSDLDDVVAVDREMGLQYARYEASLAPGENPISPPNAKKVQDAIREYTKHDAASNVLTGGRYDFPTFVELRMGGLRRNLYNFQQDLQKHVGVIRDSKAALPKFSLDDGKLSVLPAYMSPKVTYKAALEAYNACAVKVKLNDKTMKQAFEAIEPQVLGEQLNDDGLSTPISIPDPMGTGRELIMRKGNYLKELLFGNVSDTPKEVRIMTDAKAETYRQKMLDVLWGYLDFMMFVAVDEEGDVHYLCDTPPPENRKGCMYYVVPEVLNALLKQESWEFFKDKSAGLSGAVARGAEDGVKKWQEVMNAYMAHIDPAQKAYRHIDDIFGTRIIIGETEILTKAQLAKDSLIEFVQAARMDMLVAIEEKIPEAVAKVYREAGAFGRFSDRAIGFAKDTVLFNIQWLGKVGRDTEIEQWATWHLDSDPERVLYQHTLPAARRHLDRVNEILEHTRKYMVAIPHLMEQEKLLAQELKFAADKIGTAENKINALHARIEGRRQMLKGAILTAVALTLVVATGGTMAPVIFAAAMFLASTAVSAGINLLDAKTGRNPEACLKEFGNDLAIFAISSVLALGFLTATATILARAGALGVWATRSIAGRMLVDTISNLFISATTLSLETGWHQGKWPHQYTREDWERLGASLAMGVVLGWGMLGISGLAGRIRAGRMLRFTQEKIVGVASWIGKPASNFGNWARPTVKALWGATVDYVRIAALGGRRLPFRTPDEYLSLVALAAEESRAGPLAANAAAKPDLPVRPTRRPVVTNPKITNYLKRRELEVPKLMREAQTELARRNFGRPDSGDNIPFDRLPANLEEIYVRRYGETEGRALAKYAREAFNHFENRNPEKILKTLIDLDTEIELVYLYGEGKITRAQAYEAVAESIAAENGFDAVFNLTGNQKMMADDFYKFGGDDLMGMPRAKFDALTNEQQSLVLFRAAGKTGRTFRDHELRQSADRTKGSPHGSETHRIQVLVLAKLMGKRMKADGVSLRKLYQSLFDDDIVVGLDWDSTNARQHTFYKQGFHKPESKNFYQRLSPFLAVMDEISTAASFRRPEAMRALHNQVFKETFDYYHAQPIPESSGLPTLGKRPDGIPPLSERWGQQAP